MSIFKGTLHNYVSSQLKAREIIVSQQNSPVRNSKFLKYVSSKNGWTRMTSFVSFNGSSDLAKKYVLEGGTLYNDDPTNNGDFKLRYGVGATGSTYASDIDYVGLNSNVTGSRFRTYGYRPMPGITSVSVSNKGAYGSLRQATITYQCWDPHQLSELEKLFMRPGFTVLLEWGWSKWLGHSIADVNKSPSGIEIYNMFQGDNSIDVFGSEWTEDELYDEIENKVEKYRGNYDAMLGFVTNFSWRIMSNGGFECTTVLISRGEALTSIKASSNPYTTFDKTVPVDGYYLGGVIEGSGTVANKPSQPLLIKMLNNIKAYINKTNIYNSQGEFYVNYDKNLTPDPTVVENNADILAKIVDDNISEMKTIVDNTYVAEVGANGEIKYGTYSGLGYNFLGDIKPYYSRPVWDKNGNSNSTFEYISISDFFALINAYLIPKDKATKKPLFYLVLPYKTPILACEDSVSVSPKVLFKNSNASFITNETDGFDPKFYSINDTAFTTNVNSAGYLTWDKEHVLGFEFLETAGTRIHTDKTTSQTNVGILSSLILEIDNLIQHIDSKTDITDLLTSVLDDISVALGGINDLKLHTTKNLIQVIDAKYLENGKRSDKFKFDLIGLKSICRDVNINSRVFSEQSSMMAIAAAASGDERNLGDIYSTTQQWFNKGLKDRVIKEIVIAQDIDTSNRGGGIPPELNYYYDLYHQVNSITLYLRKILGKPGTLSDGRTISTWNISHDVSYNEMEDASAALRTVLLQLNGKDIDFKAVIPIELEITLDGIGGFVIGQIFVVDPSILPRQYQDANVGFIITGVAESIKNNDWTTTLRTQICILDADDIPSKLSPTDKAKLKTILTTIRTNSKVNTLLIYAMADYLSYLTINVLNATNTPPNSPGYAEKWSNLANRQWQEGSELLKEDTFTNPSVITPVALGLGGTKIETDYGPLEFDKSNTNLPAVSNATNTKTQVAALDNVIETIASSFVLQFFKKNDDCYLKRWFDKVKAEYPSDPVLSGISDYMKLTVVPDPTGRGGPDIDLSPNIETFDKYIIKEGYGVIHSANKNTIQAQDIFLYKVFGLDPFGQIKTNKYWFKYPDEKPPNENGNFGGYIFETTITPYRLHVYNLSTQPYANAVYAWIKSTWGSNASLISAPGSTSILSAEGGNMSKPYAPGTIPWFKHKFRYQYTPSPPPRV